VLRGTSGAFAIASTGSTFIIAATLAMGDPGN
jgi:hypothetical protein